VSRRERKKAHAFMIALKMKPNPVIVVETHSLTLSGASRVSHLLEHRHASK
jgi:hypothetical protein